MIKRIAITGPESTGKSYLTEKLARHFHAMWVPEFARVYIDHLDRDYTYDDILFIAKSQMESEAVAIDRTKDFLFCDTELIVAKIWCEFTKKRSAKQSKSPPEDKITSPSPPFLASRLPTW